MSQTKFVEGLEQLSRDEFADAIAKGLGRALLYVKNYGLDRVKDLVLNACLQALSYDAQCEVSRAKWLFAMFADSPYYLEFRDAITASMSIETETWTLLQLCGLAKEMALRGDKIAEQALVDRVYKHAAKFSSDDWLGAEELITVRGIDGAIELARIYGQRLLKDPDDWVPSDFEIYTEKSAEIIAIFEQYTATEESIATYYRYLIDREAFITYENRKPYKSPPREQISVEAIIDLARKKEGEYPGAFYMRCRHLTLSELEIIFELLPSEADEDICLRLLWVFLRKPLPRLVDRFFDWADSQNDRLRDAAIQVLSQTSDDRVYQLGRRKLANRQLTGGDVSTIDLFINNYHTGDAGLILAGLNEVRIDDIHEVHSIGFSIVNFSEKQSNPELGVLLNWLYDRTPCANCRGNVIDELKKYDQMSDILLAEYRFDSTQWEG